MTPYSFAFRLVAMHSDTERAFLAGSSGCSAW